MNIVIGLICIGIAALMIGLHFFFAHVRRVSKAAYEKGRDEGYQAGRREVDNWWCGIDEEHVQNARRRA